jgi:hypothetical protein
MSTSIPRGGAKASAVSNAILSIHKDKRFPHKVLAGTWNDYLFFEPFIMFAPCFIDVTYLLLSGEDASIIALINLGSTIQIEHDTPPSIFIDQNTEAKEYVSELESTGKPVGWRYLMDRYTCASDKGAWSIYCEKENDVAVFAFRNGFPQSIVLQVGKLLKATPIRNSSSAGDTTRFDFGKLLPEWRSTLVAEHSPLRA